MIEKPHNYANIYLTQHFCFFNFHVLTSNHLEKTPNQEDTIVDKVLVILAI